MVGKETVAEDTLADGEKKAVAVAEVELADVEEAPAEDELELDAAETAAEEAGGHARAGRRREKSSGSCRGHLKLASHRQLFHLVLVQVWSTCPKARNCNESVCLIRKVTATSKKIACGASR